MQPDVNLAIENLKFYIWLLTSICSLGVTLMAIYLRLYVKAALLEHIRVIEELIATDYVRRDVHELQMEALRNQLGG